MNGREIKLYRPRLKIIYGNYCIMCGQTPKELGISELEIHEIVHERPLKMANMRLMCHGCNHLESLNKENTDGGGETPTIYKVSRQNRPIFLEYVSGEMMKNLDKDGCEIDELVADSALYTGMVEDTVKKWLRPLYKGKTGPYIEWGNRLYLKGKEPRGQIQNLPKRDQELPEEDQKKMK